MTTEYSHYIEEPIKISHSDLSIDEHYDEKIDEYDRTDFITYLKDIEVEFLSNLPKKNRKPIPELQICSKLFKECKDKFKGITAMIIYDEVSAIFELDSTLLYENLSKPIQRQLIKELKEKVSLDKYNKAIKNEFIERNGAIQPTFESKSHNQII